MARLAIGFVAVAVVALIAGFVINAVALIIVSIVFCFSASILLRINYYRMRARRE